jgi:uncharacterized protein YlaN (UPF0358 family)
VANHHQQILHQKMTQTQSQLLRSIEQQLDNLMSLNEMVLDYWMSELCDENDELIPEKCTEEVLSQLEKDVYDNDN